MSAALPLTTLASAYVAAKVRQLRRDAVLFGFVCLMAFMVSGALFSAFALLVAGTYGMIAGLLATAGLALVLGLLAIAVRVVLRRRARRSMTAAMAGSASVLAVSSVAHVVARNKTTAIVAGLAIVALAAVMARSGKD